VSNEVVGGFTAVGYFGVSEMGWGFSGGSGTPAGPSETIWGVSAGMPGGLAQGFNMFGVAPVPEPSTIALAGLSSLALLLFRRRK
jgi:hypothetical protein